MARLFLDSEPLTQYKDRLFKGSMEEYLDRLRSSATLYVGNVSFFTSEEQIWSLFAKCGVVKTVIMGLDKHKLTPCGFCFVEYHNRVDAERAVKCLNGTKLDDREVRIDFDWGFQDGRQFGRGKSGGQVRDEYRTNYDAGRAGYGVRQQAQQRLGERARASVRARSGDAPRGGGDHVAFPPPPRGERRRRRVGTTAARRRRAQGRIEARGGTTTATRRWRRRRGNPRFRGDDADSDED